MGDIWLPGFPPRGTSFNACLAVTGTIFPTRALAIIFAALAGSEGGFDINVINDTPGTGDYSVGLWQINYYNGLYSERAAEFGPPAHLLAGGIGRQANAAHTIWEQQGLGAWTSYTSGAWRNYVGGAAGVPGPQGPQADVGPAPQAPARDWSAYVARTASAYRSAAGAAVHWGNGLTRI